MTRVLARVVGSTAISSYYNEISLELLHGARIGVGLELAVVIPTFNENKNIGILLDRLEEVLEDIRFEVIVVDDDSPDGTAEVVRQIARRKPNVRVLRRIGRRGLASACLEGMLATSAPYIAVMDGDLQHDESILPRLLETAMNENCDVVVASRHVEGASMGGFAESRVRLSNLGMWLSRMVLRNAPVTDPMSGFFLVSREFLESTVYRVSGVGFKILLDLLASAPDPVTVAEVPYTFRNRLAGESKLDCTVGLEYLYLLLDKLIGATVPVRFVLYSLVGAAGVVLHLGTLGLLFRSGLADFITSQIAATFLSMTANFLLNNLVTYRDARLRGSKLVAGFITFALACSVGAALNLLVSERLLSLGAPWVAAGVAGLAISSVWNYGVTSVVTWRRRRLQHA